MIRDLTYEQASEEIVNLLIARQDQKEAPLDYLGVADALDLDLAFTIATMDRMLGAGLLDSCTDEWNDWRDDAAEFVSANEEHMMNQEASITGKPRLWLLSQSIAILGMVRGETEERNALVERAQTVLARHSSEAHFDSYEIDLEHVIGECEEVVARVYGTSLEIALHQLFDEFCDKAAWAVEERGAV